MAKPRKTALKRTKRGYVRNLGTNPDGNGQPKFYLGHDRSEAIRRLNRIMYLWQRCTGWDTQAHGDVDGRWDENYLVAAKAISKGETPSLPPGPTEHQTGYFQRLNEISKGLGIQVQPTDLEYYKEGQEDTEEYANFLLGQLDEAAGQTLHEALRAYQAYIEREYQGTDGTITDNGKTKVRQIEAILRYVSDVDLSTLDYEGVDEIFGVFRRRPVSKRYGTPMARKSCTNYMGEIGRFFDWLHHSKDFRWKKPADYVHIKRSPRELEEDAEKDAAEIPVWTVEQLALINSYATPLERVFVLLGLNAAYGADQSGRLRIRHLHLSDEKASVIKRIRLKRKTKSVHLLWQQTEEALRWALDRRKKQPLDDDILLLTDRGTPYWSKTKGGNRSQLIPNLWRRLIERVQKDHPEFPWLPFNSLRDTSANMVRQIGGQEVALVHLAHRHQSSDKNLRRYTNPVRKKHFKVLRRLEKRLQPVFDAAGPDPWSLTTSNIGKKKAKELLELREQGAKVPEIAQKLGISTSTVYRHIQAAERRAAKS